MKKWKIKQIKGNRMYRIAETTWETITITNIVMKKTNKCKFEKFYPELEWKKNRY